MFNNFRVDIRKFAQFLRKKNSLGNMRTIHLNALPDRQYTKLGLDNLRFIQEQLPQEFLEKLFTKESFSIEIKVKDLTPLADSIRKLEKEKEYAIDSEDQENLKAIESKLKSTMEEVKKFKQILKSLNTLYSKSREEEQELGVKTFAFGYPMIIKRSNTNPKKIIKAPLIIWYLDIEQSPSQARTWRIKRNENHPIIVNNVLISHIENDLNISINTVNELLPDEGLISLDNVREVLKKVILNINPQSGNLLEKELSIRNLDKFPDSAGIEEKTISSKGLFWINNGVFGCYRISKESILADLKRMEEINLLEENDSRSEEKLSPLSPIETDPSQQKIINSLQQVNEILIQGPPGTGKSQSLTAIIANAMSNKKKCLVVCEKKTALDVISDNLTKQGLGSLVTTITNPISDRNQIVHDIRDLSDTQHSYNFLPEENFKRNEQTILNLIEKINKQHQSLTSIDFGSQTWTALVGDFLETKRYIKENPLENVINEDQYNFDVEEYREMLEEIEHIYRYFFEIKSIRALREINKEIFINLHVLESQREVEREISQNRLLIEELIKDIQKFEDQYKEKNLKYLKESYSEVEKSFKEISMDLISIRDSYKLDLEKFYSDTFTQLKLKMTNIQSLLSENKDLYKDSFIKNTSLNRSFTSILSPFSLKFRNIKKGKKDIEVSIEDLEQYINSNRVLKYNFSKGWDLKRMKNLEELENSLDKFAKYVSQFHEKIPSEINFYSDSLSLGTYKKHPYIDYSERIEMVKEKFQKVNNLINANPILGISVIEYEKDISKLIKQVERDLSQIQSLIRDVNTKVQTIMESLSLSDSSLNPHVDISKEYKGIIGKESILRERIGILLKNNQLGSKLKFAELKSILNRIDSFLGEAQNEIQKSWKEYYDFQKEFDNLSEKVKNIAQELYMENIQEHWKEYFTNWYFAILLERIYSVSELPDKKTGMLLDNLKIAIKENQDQQKKQILAIWAKEQNLMKQRFESNSYNPRNLKSLYNLRGANGQRRNSLRKIIEKDFDLFTSFKPVILTNPTTCSAIFPLKEGLFDIVIFDEASQLRIEDTFPALYRGKTKIISGDKHQMPPSSYFGSNNTFIDSEELTLEEEENGQEDLKALADDYRKDLLNLVDSESLLDFAESLNFKYIQLDTHYRSRHPDLIEFSNAAFYGSNLIPLPQKTDDIPIEFHRVDGLYEDNENIDEIRYIFNLLRKIERDSDGKYPSIGIATFNQKQQARFYEEIFNLEDEEFRNKILEMQQQRDGLFIKNLENIQGEERDIIILSTTFGKDKENRFIQNFGPINQAKGYRLLNVLVTRAKKKIHVCTSVPEEYISTYSSEISRNGNTGKGIFYAYLAYAKAVSENNRELKEQILELLREKCFQRNHTTDNGYINQTESIFEEEVISRLEDYIDPDRIIAQYPAGGFRIDFVVKDLSGKPRLAIECDGAKYHSSPEAYCWDLCRQQQLEDHGFIFHRIWSTDWFTNEEKELKRLLAFISENENPNNEERSKNVKVQNNNVVRNDPQIGIPFNETSLGDEIEILGKKNPQIMTTLPESILLQDLNVNQFTKNYLKEKGIKTAQDLLLIDRRKLIGLGLKNIDRLRDELKKHNIDSDFVLPSE